MLKLLLAALITFGSSLTVSAQRSNADRADKRIEGGPQNNGKKTSTSTSTSTKDLDTRGSASGNAGGSAYKSNSDITGRKSDTEIFPGSRFGGRPK